MLKLCVSSLCAKVMCFVVFLLYLFLFLFFTFLVILSPFSFSPCSFSSIFFSFSLELRYKIYFDCSAQPLSKCKGKLHVIFNWKNEKVGKKIKLGIHTCIPLKKSEQRLDKRKRIEIQNTFRLNGDTSSQSVVCFFFSFVDFLVAKYILLTFCASCLSCSHIFIVHVKVSAAISLCKRCNRQFRSCFLRASAQN